MGWGGRGGVTFGGLGGCCRLGGKRRGGGGGGGRRGRRNRRGRIQPDDPQAVGFGRGPKSQTSRATFDGQQSLPSPPTPPPNVHPINLNYTVPDLNLPGRCYPGRTESEVETLDFQVSREAETQGLLWGTQEVGGEADYEVMGCGEAERVGGAMVFSGVGVVEVGGGG